MDIEPRPICKLGGYTRDRQGCLTCRRRKKKCAGSGASLRERCAPCLRLNLRCEWEDEQRVVPLSSSPREHALVVAPPRSMSMPGDLQQGTVHRRMAMRYYVQSFAATLSTNAENNGFLSVLLPMAMDSNTMLDALVAWSTSHLALQQEGMHVRALEDRHQALVSFGRGLHHLPRETAVAICLILTSMESILGDTDNWYRHLAAAASIIRDTLTTRAEDGRVVSGFQRTSEGRWLLRNFAYHDILASISLGCDLLIPDLDWLGEDEERHTLDTYLGLGSVPFTLLGQISALTSDLVRADAVATSRGVSRRTVLGEVSFKLADLEIRLLDWRPDRAQSESLIALAEIYRSAALICLYRALRLHGLADAGEVRPKIDSQVAQVIQHVAQMPVGCLPECTLLFPLFITGGETQNTDYQQAIEGRMKSIVQDRYFENVRVALDVLREVWDVKARTVPIDPSRPYDWTSVLERRQWSLALS